MGNKIIQSGFTLIELLVVIAILAILLTLSFGSWRNQIDKARDSQKKTHLQRLKTAFEDYFNDRGCYPPATILDNCTGPELKPYLDKIPCDPVTETAYIYLPDLSQPACIKSYKLFAHLNNLSDPTIKALGCDGQLGCGYEPALNYGVASSDTILSILPPMSPSPSPQGPIYYCQDYGNCTVLPTNLNCSPIYPDSNCGTTNLCADTKSACIPK